MRAVSLTVQGSARRNEVVKAIHSNKNSSHMGENAGVLDVAAVLTAVGVSLLTIVKIKGSFFCSRS